jgi:hypothetical protein
MGVFSGKSGLIVIGAHCRRLTAATTRRSPLAYPGPMIWRKPHQTVAAYTWPHEHR